MTRESWVDSVNDAIIRSVVTQQNHLELLGADVGEFVTYADTLLRGGKRFRAQFAFAGALALGNADSENLITIAGGLEVFHAAALVHDDIMDNSDTRRGKPAAHRHFAALHRSNGWAGDADAFGASAAILFGDFLLALSDAMVADGLRHLPAERVSATRLEIDRMKLDVTAGQYLDIVEENAWPNVAKEHARSRASRVVEYKSAKYSIEAPLVIGALVSGATGDDIDGFRNFALPLGHAFQLRDDLLGVFGDESVTGKPVGDDLREGKRTVLIAMAQESMTSAAFEQLNETLGNLSATETEIARAQRAIEESGARDELEKLIDAYFEESLDALSRLHISTSGAELLTDLAHRVVRRDS